MIRLAVKYFEPTCEARLDALLLTGGVDKKVGDWNASMCRTPAQISSAKLSGVYYKAFSKSPGSCFPRQSLYSPQTSQPLFFLSPLRYRGAT